MRQLFSFEYDHKIEQNSHKLDEKQYKVLSALTHTLQNLKNNQKVNIKYFYNLMLTSANIKLCHPICHLTGRHEGQYVDNTKCIL